jgi:hypothetical protein
MQSSLQRVALAGSLGLLWIGSAVAVTACGSTASTESNGAAAEGAAEAPAVAEEIVAEATPTPVPDVTLKVRKPSRTVHRSSVRISGTATRGASVKVHGRKVAVKRGRFARTVRLERGKNTIVVRASKRGMEPTQTKFTVTRKLTQAELAAIAARKRAAAAARVANFKNNAATIPYNQLNKNADRYEGKIVKYTGQILQIQEDGSGGFMLLSVTNLGYGIYDDNIWVDYSGSIRSADGDIVTIYGKVTGSKSYETQIGGETYVPQVKMRYIEE